MRLDRFSCFCVIAVVILVLMASMGISLAENKNNDKDEKIAKDVEEKDIIKQIQKDNPKILIGDLTVESMKAIEETKKKIELFLEESHLTLTSKEEVRGFFQKHINEMGILLERFEETSILMRRIGDLVVEFENRSNNLEHLASQDPDSSRIYTKMAERYRTLVSDLERYRGAIRTTREEGRNTLAKFASREEMAIRLVRLGQAMKATNVLKDVATSFEGTTNKLTKLIEQIDQNAEDWEVTAR